MSQGLTELRVLICSNNPLIELNLTGTNIKGECANLEKTLLWKQLNAVGSSEEQQRIIARLGKDYTYANCLYYAPSYVTNTSKVFFSNIFSQAASYMPSFSSALSDSSVVEEVDEEYKNNKRKRSDINEEDSNESQDNLKRMKK